MGSPNNPPKTRCKKRRFQTQQGAVAGLAEAKTLNDARGQPRKNRTLHAYECPDCGFWHVGHAQWAEEGE